MPSQLSLLPQDLAALRGLLALISDPVLVLNEALELLESNPAAQALLGLTAERGLSGLPTSHGGKLGDWLRLSSRAITEGRRGPTPASLTLSNGLRAGLSLMPL